MATNSNDVWIHDGNERRKLEGQELIDYKANIALTLADLEAEKTRKEAETSAKQALLTKLGITADEAKLLLS